MSSLFIDKNEEFNVNFVVATHKEEKTIWCDKDEESLRKIITDPSQYDFKSYKASFRKPNFGDTINLYGSVFSTDINGKVAFNPLDIRYKKIVALLKDWNLTDDIGEKVPPTKQNIMRLHPMIAHFIGTQVETQTGSILT